MELRKLFEEYLALEPEEGATLGIATNEFRDPTLDGVAKRDAFYRRAIDATEGEADLDARALHRLACFERHLYDSGAHHKNPLWAGYAYTMLRYREARGESIAECVPKISAYLAADEARLDAARRSGSVAPAPLLSYQTDVLFPAAASYLEDKDRFASAAFLRHRDFYQTELLPAASDDGALGADEYDARWGLSFPGAGPRELVGRAAAVLRELQERILDVVRRLQPDDPPSGFPAAAEWARELQSQTLAEGTDVRAHYQAVLRNVCEFVEARKLFSVGDALSELGMAEYPSGMDVGPGTNWPAPLLRAGQKGQFVVQLDPATHPSVWVPVLAIHEGIPGHFLQSWAFQRAFQHHEAPFRFLCVADDVAIPRGYFGAMLNIEGYAVYAEERMRRAGFHDDRGELFALIAHAVRAVRVIAEVGFHRRERDSEETMHYVSQETGLPLRSAKFEVFRYQCAPLQAVSYFAGAEEFFTLAEATTLPLPDFHQRLFDFGPVPPSEIGKRLSQQPASVETSSKREA
ncbi:MAG: DUF885 family protein [Myxococcota bacterium]